MTFNPVENMEKLQVNHIDGNKHNNNIYNLEWCTQIYNQEHAWKNGLCKNSIGFGEKSHHHKLSLILVNSIREEIKNEIPVKNIIRKYGIGRSTYYQIKNNITWNK